MSSDPTDPIITSSIWARDAGEDLTAELIGGGTIDEIARAANEHGIMITLTFVPATMTDNEGEDE